MAIVYRLIQRPGILSFEKKACIARIDRCGVVACKRRYDRSIAWRGTARSPWLPCTRDRDQRAIALYATEYAPRCHAMSQKRNAWCHAGSPRWLCCRPATGLLRISAIHAFRFVHMIWGGTTRTLATRVFGVCFQLPDGHEVDLSGVSLAICDSLIGTTLHGQQRTALGTQRGDAWKVLRILPDLREEMLGSFEIF
jgi:hypothetical protein